ncbi:MAG: TRAP transporter permease [Euzebyales bacterium]|jgi:TRAP transporter 4TM/12TM fusion protein|nr:TRAP transporter permease [Euzebyales bacterium]
MLDAPGQEVAAGAVKVRGAALWTVKILGTVYALYYIVTAQAGLQSPQAHRGLYIGGATILILLLFPGRRGRERTSVPFYDWVLAGLAAVSSVYFVFFYPDMVGRAGLPTTTDIVMGALIIALSIEVTRRTVGWTLAIIGLASIVYVFAGPWMPGLLIHRGHGVDRFVASQFMSFGGVFGLVADIFATFVLLFIFFGTILERSGAAQFFIDLPYAIAGRFRGGPAKAAILVSALMGSISGSAVANVMTTGTFTIPLMKRVGYRKEFAGGVETAASTGGQMLPPVMGAGAFIIAEFTRTPYTTIVLVSIVPALLYFVTVYLLVDFEALKKNLAGVPSDELERPLDVLKRGWYLFLPVGVIFWLILADYSPAFAAFWGIIAGLAVGFVPYQGRRMGARDVFDAMWQGSVKSLAVAGVVGTIGVVLGVLNLTGLGLKFTDLVVAASGGRLLVALILVTLASWVLGAGLTATSSYVIVAILAAPALEQLGLSLLVAHLIIFWVSQDANLTPPICIAAFAAASIADAKPMATGFESWKLGRGLYIVPLLMAYSPLIGGTPMEVAQTAGTALIGIYGLCAGTSQYLLRRTRWWETGLLVVGGGLLIAPGWTTNLTGTGLMALAWVLQGGLRRTGRKVTEVAAS